MSLLIGSEIRSHKPVNINLSSMEERVLNKLCMSMYVRVGMITPLNSMFTQIMFSTDENLLTAVLLVCLFN